MAYIGKAPGGTGVRQRYLYTATNGQTTFTTSDSGLALSYTDTNYMDVYQNGVLLDPANDYTATSGTSVVFGTGATTGDVIEIIVYDVFSVFNNTVTGNFTVGNNLTVSGTSTLATVDINAGNIDGTTIGAATPAAGTFTTLTASGNLTIDTNTLFVDASANTVIVGDAPSSIDGSLGVRSNANSHAISIYEPVGANENWQIGVDADGDLGFYNSGSTTASVTFDDSGSVGIGTSSPSSLTTLSASGANAILELNRNTTNTTGAVGAINFTASDGHSVANMYAQGDGNNEGAHLVFRTTSSAGENDPYGSNTFERMRIDSSGNLLVGKTNTTFSTDGISIHGEAGQERINITRASNPVLNLNRKTSDGEIARFYKDSSQVGSIGVYVSDRLYIADGSNGLQFDQTVIRPCDNTGANTDDVVSLGSSGSRFQNLYLSDYLILGADSGDGFNSDSSLRLQNSGNNYIQIKSPTTNQVGLLMGDTSDDFAGGIIYNNSGDYLRFDSDNAERFRITGAQFMFGQTTSSPLEVISATGGDAIGINSSDGYVSIKRNAGAGLYINKTDSAAGELIQFRTNGTKTGVIGLVGTNVFISDNADTGLKFDGSGTDNILPCNDSGTGRDNAIDLGSSGTRFKDLFLSGGLYVGGTGSANYLDDYEEGTFTPTYVGSSSNPTITYDRQHGEYVKIGRQVIARVEIITDAVSGGSGNVYISGLPFAVVGNSGVRAGSVVIGYSSSWSTENPQAAYLNSGTNRVILVTNNSSDARDGLNNTVQVTNMGTGTNDNFIMATLFYTTS